MLLMIVAIFTKHYQKDLNLFNEEIDRLYFVGDSAISLNVVHHLFFT
jgi:hypothetical protein